MNLRTALSTADFPVEYSVAQFFFQYNATQFPVEYYAFVLLVGSSGGP